MTLVVEAIPQISLQVCCLIHETIIPFNQSAHLSRVLYDCACACCSTTVLQGVHKLPDFARKLADVIASVLDAAAAAAAAAAVSPAGTVDDDFENVVCICCDSMTDIAKACKLASLNRDCSIPEVCSSVNVRVHACQCVCAV